MASLNRSDKEYATIDDDTSYNYLHIIDVSPRSDRTRHNTQEKYKDDVHHYQSLRKGAARERPRQKSYRKATSKEAKQPKTCCRLTPWFGWLLIVIGISLFCVFVALLGVLLKGK